jgi:hypothetical protein
MVSTSPRFSGELVRTGMSIRLTSLSPFPQGYSQGLRAEW